MGRRIAKSVNNFVTWYVYDGNAILAAYDSSGTITARYAHGLNIDKPLAVRQGSITSFYHADGLGSIVALTNMAGSVVQTYGYDSFGNITPSGGINQPYTYTAREYDTETGLCFYRARYYDPKVGRFITKDPISFSGGDVNLYSYVSNDPVNWIDPLGLAGCTAGQLASCKITCKLIGKELKDCTPDGTSSLGPFNIPIFTCHCVDKPGNPDKPCDVSSTPPKGSVENPNRPGSYGEYGPDGKFKETWRYDKGRPGVKSGHGSNDHIHIKK
ncbi:MAG: RHS repeat-associated core domain-containing protein [Syntrophaceae bacterium]